MVVDLAIEGEPNRPVLVRHRLSAGVREVDDAETPMTEHDTPLGTLVHAGGVRPAVGDRLHSALHEITPIARRRREIEDTYNTAHTWSENYAHQLTHMLGGIVKREG